MGDIKGSLQVLLSEVLRSLQQRLSQLADGFTIPSVRVGEQN